MRTRPRLRREVLELNLGGLSQGPVRVDTKVSKTADSGPQLGAIPRKGD